MLDRIDISSSVAVYVQIENQVRFAVAAGTLKPGDNLPAITELADRLGVNVNTVAKAYRDLEVMGIVTGRRGMGVYIQKGIESKCRHAVRNEIASKLGEVIGEAKAAGFTLKGIRAITDKLSATEITPYSNDEALVRALQKL